MNNDEIERVVTSLADTLAKTRAELDAMRIMLTGVTAVVSTQPSLLPPLSGAIRAAMEVDAATALASPMPDEYILQRTEWLKRLMPPPLRQSVLPDA